MTQYTAAHNLPKPEAGESPNGPLQIGALADAVDTALPVRSRGASNVATEQGTASSTYTLLATPDRVQNLILPTDGMIMVWAHVGIRRASSQGRVGLFLNNEQVRATPPVQGPNLFEEVVLTDSFFGTSDRYISTAGRLYAPQSGFDSDDAYAPATTGHRLGFGQVSTGDPALQGEAVGGAPICIFAAAGTYDVSLRFRRTGGSGNLSAFNRRLWAWAVRF